MDAASKKNFGAIQEAIKRQAERADELERRLAALENQQQQWENRFNGLMQQMVSIVSAVKNVR